MTTMVTTNAVGNKIITNVLWIQIIDFYENFNNFKIIYFISASKNKLFL